MTVWSWRAAFGVTLAWLAFGASAACGAGAPASAGGEAEAGPGPFADGGASADSAVSPADASAARADGGDGASSSGPPVLFVFVSHNEETPQWSGTPYYLMNRQRVIALADYFKARGIAWNLQSDWVYLTSAATQEVAPLTDSTGGKNLLRWLAEDRGVELDPHAHESRYLYPDVVKLMDDLGLPESKLMGGTIYNAKNGMNQWTNLVDGQQGSVFPARTWRPDYMMGGGTPNHVADLKYFGFWRPKSPSDYLTDDPASHLRHIGIGCENKIKTETAVEDALIPLRDLLDRARAGQYPTDGFYVQSIFFSQADLNDAAFFEKVQRVADGAAALVAGGGAKWATLKQAYTQWETRGARVFQWQCGDLVGSDK